MTKRKRLSIFWAAILQTDEMISGQPWLDLVINRPGVAGAVLKTASSLIH